MRQQLGRVAGQCFAERFAIFTKLGYFTAAFAEAQEQAQRKGADNQPGRDKYSHDNRSGNGPQAKADRYYYAIQNHHLFEQKRIENHQHNIRHDDNCQRPGKHITSNNRHCSI
ncbi:hypothetical protein ES703_84135 [subsurface metagenome]